MPPSRRDEAPRATPPDAKEKAEELFQEDPVCGFDLGGGKVCGLRKGHPPETPHVPAEEKPAAEKPVEGGFLDQLVNSTMASLEKLPPVGEEITTVTKELNCKLSDKEVADLAVEGSGIWSRMQDLEYRRRDVLSRLKAEKDNLTAEHNRVMSAVNEGVELRQVKVTIHKDFPTRKRWEVRTDTGETIPGSERALTQAEIQEMLDKAQTSLPLEVKKDDAAKDGAPTEEDGKKKKGKKKGDEAPPPAA